MEQLDHSRNPFRVLFFIGQVVWNNYTIFLKKNPKKSIKQIEKKRKRGRVFTIILLYKTYYTKSKENKFSNAFAP
jgi:hypothetical protein